MTLNTRRRFQMACHTGSITDVSSGTQMLQTQRHAQYIAKEPGTLHSRSSRNRSGVIGIHRRWRRTSPNPYLIWGVSYIEDGVFERKDFSTKHYGEEEAFHRACEFRCEKHGKLIVTNLDKIPYRLRVPYKLSDAD